MFWRTWRKSVHLRAFESSLRFSQELRPQLCLWCQPHGTQAACMPSSLHCCTACVLPPLSPCTRLHACACMRLLCPYAQSVRQVKGVLNKLTPEKFERLLQQLLEVITTADVLKQTITLVFENAVEQPTYCAMYADLCLHLSKELPSFPPPAGSDKPLAFRQILLNTCQDEFEEAMTQREVGAASGEGRGGEAAGRACGVLFGVCVCTPCVFCTPRTYGVHVQQGQGWWEAGPQ